MYSHVEININKDELERERYIFYYLDETLWLDKYFSEKRETKRHKYKIVKHYNRLSARESNVKEEDVPISKEIKQEALNAFIARLNVKLWSERRK